MDGIKSMPAGPADSERAGGKWMAARAALYLRLSRSDGREGESGSIASQRALLLAVCREKGFEVAGIYTDAPDKIGLNQ